MAILFYFPPYTHIGKQLIQECQIEEGFFAIHKLSNHENYLQIASSVHNKICFLLGSIVSEENLFTFLLLSDTLKREGASHCIALLPYLAYTRHEHAENNKSQATCWMGKLFEASRLDCVWTLDLHSTLAADLFTIPLISLSTASLFYEALQKDSWYPDVVIAPDRGARERCLEVAQLLHLPVSVLHKKRDKDGITHAEIEGRVKEKALIVDDILDTGATLLSCCQKLLANGVKEIRLAVSHGLFIQDHCENLLNFPIYCTDSVQPRRYPCSVDVLPIAPLLKRAIDSSLCHGNSFGACPFVGSQR